MKSIFFDKRSNLALLAVLGIGLSVISHNAFAQYYEVTTPEPLRCTASGGNLRGHKSVTIASVAGVGTTVSFLSGESRHYTFPIIFNYVIGNGAYYLWGGTPRVYGASKVEFIDSRSELDNSIVAGATVSITNMKGYVYITDTKEGFGVSCSGTLASDGVARYVPWSILDN